MSETKQIMDLALANFLWDELRNVACSTKLNAHCIVMLNKKDFSDFIKKIDKDRIMELILTK